MVRYLRKFPAFIFLAVFFIRCAHPLSPPGGPKDTQPPQVVETKPENGSARFTGNKFTLEFDEFIRLENIMEEGLISPPVNQAPDFKIKGKSLQVRFNESLKPNTTYSVYFGNAIVDITEKNPLSNYTYLLSTGDFVDSLSLQGEVIDAFNMDPVEGAFVLLYKNNNDTLPFDSLPLAVRPYYLSKTDAKGRFVFHGLADEKYMIFALNDMNRNYIFDQPAEAIAFLDSLVVPQYIEPSHPDTTVADSSLLSLTDTVTTVSADSSFLLSDSLLLPESAEEHLLNYTLLMFTHKDSVQKLLKAELLRLNTLQFSFSKPATNIHIKVLNFNLDSSWFKAQFTPDKDTLRWYIKDLPVDTLQLLFLEQTDTLEMVYLRLKPKQKISGRKRKKDTITKKRYLEWSTNFPNKILTLDQQPRILFDQPIASYYTDSAWLANSEDTIYNPAFYFMDSLHRQIQIPLELEEESRYSIYFPDSAFTDWNGIHSKAISLDIITKSLREYGTFSINLHPAKNQNYIVQLLGDKEAIVRQDVFRGDTTIIYNYVKAKKYLLKLIFDDNENGKWDAGNYLQKKQPEKIIYFMKEINVRANWEIEEDWAF